MSCRRGRKKHLETRVPNEKKVFWLITDIIEIENDSVLIRPALKCYPRLGMSCSWAFFGTVYRYLWFFINFWWQLWSATCFNPPCAQMPPKTRDGAQELLGGTRSNHHRSMRDKPGDSSPFTPWLTPWLTPCFCTFEASSSMLSYHRVLNWGDFLGSPSWECNQKYKPVATAISKHLERLRQQRGTQFLRSMNLLHCSILICLLWLFLNRKIIAWLQCVNASQ